MQEVAKPVFLSRFAFFGLHGVAPYCVPGGVKVVSEVAGLPREKPFHFTSGKRPCEVVALGHVAAHLLKLCQALVALYALGNHRKSQVVEGHHDFQSRFACALVLTVVSGCWRHLAYLSRVIVIIVLRCARVLVAGSGPGWCTVDVVVGTVNASSELEV